MRRALSSLTLATIAASALGGGCIGFHHGEARAVQPFPPAEWSRTATPAADSVPLAVTAHYALAGDVIFEMVRRAEEERVRNVVESAVDQSGYFRASHPDAQPPFSLEVDVRVQRHPNLALALLCGLTLTVFPYWAHDDYTFWAVLRGGGRVLGERRINGRVTGVMSILLVVAMPFAFPRGATDELYAETSRDLLAWSHDLLVEAAQPQPARLEARVTR